MGVNFDWVVTGIEVEADRMPKEIFFLPALALLGLIAFIQRRRAGREFEGASA